MMMLLLRLSSYPNTVGWNCLIPLINFCVIVITPRNLWIATDGLAIFFCAQENGELRIWEVLASAEWEYANSPQSFRHFASIILHIMLVFMTIVSLRFMRCKSPHCAPHGKMKTFLTKTLMTTFNTKTSYMLWKLCFKACNLLRSFRGLWSIEL